MATSKQTRPDVVASAERRAFVVQLRRAGATYRSIALAAVQHFGAARLPSGYDERQAHRDVMAELARWRKQMGEDVGVLVDLQDQRLNQLLSVWWPRALGGERGPDLKATDMVLKLLDRQARLHGLDAPTRFQVLPAPGDVNWESLSEEALAAIASGKVDDLMKLSGWQDAE